MDISARPIRWQSVLLGSLAAMAVMLALPTSAQAAFPGQNGKIAFESNIASFPNCPCPEDVYVMNPDGTNQTRITNAGGQTPAWSADGKRIAFTKTLPCCPNDHNSRAIYVMNADGSGQTFLTNGAGRPAWSPDGTKLVFSKYAPDDQTHQDLYIANADGSGESRLTATQGIDEIEPDWSPDGTKIAFERICWTCNPFDPSVSTIRPDGTDLTRLTGSGGGSSRPDWSPNGTKIVVERSGDIYTINSDGTGRTRLTFTQQENNTPVWSPDGTKIAFNSGNPPGIFTMNADGSGVTQITNNYANEGWPDWQPLPHDRPGSAALLTASLVPNYRQTISDSQCEARAGAPSTHGAPLSLSSCSPPAFVPGTHAHIGPGSSSWEQYAVIYGDADPGNGNQADMTIRASLNDIRTAGGDDYEPNPAGTDLTLVTKLRISDNYNGGLLTDHATVQDLDYQTPVDCVSTAGPEGATCSLDTSANAITPDTIRENEASVMQVFRLRVNDSGSNGTRGDADDRTFAVQGIYIP